MKSSREIRTVLTIINASVDLKRKVLPHVDLARSEIHWDQIYGCDLTHGERAAITWAHALWEGSLWVTATELGCADPFESARHMDGKFRMAVVRALAIWLGEEHG